MSILYLILVIAVVVGMTWWLGSWNIFINLVNFYISALVASSFFEPLAGKLESFDSSYEFVIDFVAIWLLFVVTFIALRICTDFLTQYRLRMNFWAEMGFRTVLSLWLAIGFACFAFFTLHLSPLPPDEFQPQPNQKLFGFGPDLMWMGFVQSRSRGALAESKSAALLPDYFYEDHPDDVDLDSRVFDPYATFGDRGRVRRQLISENETLRVAR